MDKSKNWAIFLVALSGILYGSLGLFGTWLMSDGFSVANTMFWRFAMACLTLLPFCFSHFKTIRKNVGSRELKSFLSGALLYSTSSATYFLASKSIGTGLGMVIFYTYPMMIVLYLLIFEKKPVTLATSLSLLLTCSGLILLNQNRTHRLDPFGIFLAIVCAATYAIYIVVNKKVALQINSALSTFVLCAVSALYFLIAAVSEGEFAWPSSPTSWLVIAGLGLLATAAPILLMLIGLKQVNSDQAAMLSVSEPLITVLLGAVFLDERLGLYQGVGVATLLAGTLCSIAPSKAKKTKKYGN